MVDIGSIYSTFSKSCAKLTKSKSEDYDKTSTTLSDNVTINLVFDEISRYNYATLSSSSLCFHNKYSLRNLRTEVFQREGAKEKTQASADDSYDVTSEVTIPDDHCFEMPIPKLNLNDVAINNVKSINKQSSADGNNANSVSKLSLLI